MKPDNSPTWRELLHPDVSDTIVSMFEMIDEAMEMDEPHPLDPMDEAKELKHIEQL